MSMLSALFIGLVFITLFLAGLVLWVRKNRAKKTEKNFNLAALWSCVSVFSLYILHMLETGITYQLFLLINIHVPSPSLATQILVTLLLMFYIWTVYRWSTTWDGLRTRHGYTSARDGVTIFFVADGFKEMIRLVQGLPSHEAFMPSKNEQGELVLPAPIVSEAFHQQVRDLILGRWLEYIIPETAWIEAAQCWYGNDSSIDQPILVLCAHNVSAVDPDRLRTQVKHHSVRCDPKIMAVFEQEIMAVFEQEK